MCTEGEWRSRWRNRLTHNSIHPLIQVLLNIVFILNCVPTSPVVPPPELPPGKEGVRLEADGVKVEAEGLFWIDSMPTVPREGAPFYCLFTLEVESSGDEDITEFNATAATLYYSGTKDEFHTFFLVPTLETTADETVPANSRETLNYRCQDPFSSQNLEDDSIYASIKVEWNGGEGVVTTPPEGVGVTW